MSSTAGLSTLSFRSLHHAVVLCLALSAVSHASAQDQGQGIIQMQENQMGDDERAKAHFRVGTSLYEAGRFNEAAEEWQKAFELSQRSELLYNVYVAYRDAASSNDKAIAALRKYLELGRIEATRRLQLEARLRAMEDAQAQAATTANATAAEAPAPMPPAAPVESVPTTEAPAESSSNVLPIVLIASGGVLLATSVITGLMVNSVESKLEDNCADDVCPASFDRKGEVSKGNTLIAINAVTAVTGVLALGTGIVLLLIGGGSDDTNASTAPSASFGCSTTGCTTVVSARF